MWKDYLALSRTEQRASAVLLILLLIALSTTFYQFTANSGNLAISYKSIEGVVPSNFQMITSQSSYSSVFDPNLASIKQLELLGFNRISIINIKKYIEAGGRFKGADELYNIYGVDTLLLDRIKHLVIIGGSSPQPHKNITKGSFKKRQFLDVNKLSADDLRVLLSEPLVDSIVNLRQNYWYTRHFAADEFANISIDSSLYLLSSAATLRYKEKKNSLFSFEINNADSTELDLLNGIGPTLARRIVYYRQKIGGFVSLSQLTEVQGISAELLNRILPQLTVDASLIKSLNVNEASIYRLKEHPYVGFYKAREIVEYRKLKGAIVNLSQLFELPAFQDSDTKILSHYLTTH